MLISEIIENLEKVKSEHGDLYAGVEGEVGYLLISYFDVAKIENAYFEVYTDKDVLKDQKKILIIK